jgi:hypothetical protein
MNILTSNTNSAIRYQRPTAQSEAPTTLSTQRDFFERTTNRDLGDLAAGFVLGGAGAAVGGLTGSVVGTIVGNSSGNPLVGMAAGVGIGGVVGAVAGWLYSTPRH